MFKKALTGSALILIVFALIGGITALQLLPFVAFFALSYMSLKENKKVNFYMVMLGIFMLFINLAIMSYVDILFWLLVIIAWWKE